ncbi:ZIP family metal transporter [Candidatus Roizmanbacteria bacterium]|nr:ZIP family metal transporter [Candidatus Roizmanbacteria bacterium]
MNIQAVLLSLFTFLSTFSGGLFAFKQKKRLHYIMSFTAGVLIAVCFFDILPEIFSITYENRLDITPALVAIIFGFLMIHVLEKIALIHTGHETTYASHKHPTVGLISALGLSFHSFLDGVGIGLGFHINPRVGLLIAIAVIAHDFSDGLNTVTLMLTNKNTLKKSFILLLFDAVSPIIGVLSTFIFTIPGNILQLYLGFFAGFLLYIGASDLLPEAHRKNSSYKMLFLTILGIVFIFIITRLT